MRPFVFGLLFSATSIAAFSAQAQQAPCKFEAAVSQVILRDVQVGARSAETIKSLLGELNALSKKATNPHLSIGKQLSVHDAARFTQLSEQIKSIRISNLIESDLSRDAEFANSMYERAWKLYASNDDIPEKDDFPGNFLVALRLFFPNVALNLTPVQSAECSVEAALSLQEAEAAGRSSSDPSTPHNFELLNQLKAKYGLPANGVLDPSKLSADDLRTLQRLRVALQPAFQEYQLAQDIRNILDWWRMARLVYTDRKEDISTYGSDPNSIDKTIDGQKVSFDDRSKVLLGLWYKVNEKVPSVEQRMNDALAKSTDEILKKFPPPAE